MQRGGPHGERGRFVSGFWLPWGGRGKDGVSGWGVGGAPSSFPSTFAMTCVFCCQMEGGEPGRERSESEASPFLPALPAASPSGGRFPSGAGLCRAKSPRAGVSSPSLATWRFHRPTQLPNAGERFELSSLQEENKPQAPPQPRDAPAALTHRQRRPVPARTRGAPAPAVASLPAIRTTLCPSCVPGELGGSPITAPTSLGSPSAGSALPGPAKGVAAGYRAPE